MPSLDLLFDLAKKKLDMQDAHVNTLDGKAAFVFGAANLLIAGVGVFQKTAFDTVAHLSNNGLVPDYVLKGVVLIFIVLIGVLYIQIMKSVYNAYKIREYNSLTIQPDVQNELLVKSIKNTKKVLLNTMTTIIENNRKVIEDKESWTETAVGTLTYQFWLVGLFVIVGSLSSIVA